MDRIGNQARDEMLRAARANAFATPLGEFHPGNPELFRSDTLWPYFERLRNEEPVHFCLCTSRLIPKFIHPT